MYDDMEQELIKIGLTKNESKVYVSLLELGSTSAGKIIKRTKLHRNLVYENLEKLIEKGLIAYILIKGIKHFELTNPSELNTFIQIQKQELLEKEKIVREIIPKIENKEKILQREEASIFRGIKSLRLILEEITKSKTEVLIFATGWGMKETMGTYYEQWHLKLKKNKTKGKALLSEKSKIKEELPYELKYISEDFIIPSTILIYENKILNIIWKPELTGILIVNKDVADSYKNWFEALWKRAKK